MKASQRLASVEHGVAGFAETRESLLKPKLGRPAWHVWQVLCRRRDHQGFTHVTTRGIATAIEFVEITPRLAKKALKRLATTGLLCNVGWQSRRVRCGGGFGYRKVFVRRVFGERQLCVAGDDPIILVPQTTKEWMAMASTWGGKRPSAGRKPSAATVAKRESRVSQVDSRLSHPAGIKGVPRIVYASREGVESSAESSFQEKKNAPRGAGLLTSFENESLGSGFGGDAPRVVPLLSTPLENVPAYPGYSIVSPATVPDPPKLIASDPEEYRVKLLTMAYRGAVEKQYGKKCHLLARVGPRSPSYRKLVIAADALMGYDVTPAAWCTWAVRKWFLVKTHTNGYVKGAPVQLPPVGYIFSDKKIVERLDDEDKRYIVTDSAVGGRCVFGKVHKKLLVKYGEMRGAILRGMRKGDAVAHYFPGSLYEDMVDAARIESVEIRSKLEDDARRGRMIW